MITNSYIIKLYIINYKYFIKIDKNYKNMNINRKLSISYHYGKHNLPLSLIVISNESHDNFMNIINLSYYSRLCTSKTYTKFNSIDNRNINSSLLIYNAYILGKESKFLTKLNKALSLL